MMCGLDSKEFAAQASKFQTQPNKKRNKVIIIDEEEEKELGEGASINNHISKKRLSSKIKVLSKTKKEHKKKQKIKKQLIKLSFYCKIPLCFKYSGIARP